MSSPAFLYTGYDLPFTLMASHVTPSPSPSPSDGDHDPLSPCSAMSEEDEPVVKQEPLPDTPSPQNHTIMHQHLTLKQEPVMYTTTSSSSLPGYPSTSPARPMYTTASPAHPLYGASPAHMYTTTTSSSHPMYLPTWPHTSPSLTKDDDYFHQLTVHPLDMTFQKDYGWNMSGAMSPHVIPEEVSYQPGSPFFGSQTPPLMLDSAPNSPRRTPPYQFPYPTAPSCSPLTGHTLSLSYPTQSPSPIPNDTLVWSDESDSDNSLPLVAELQQQEQQAAPHVVITPPSPTPRASLAAYLPPTVSPDAFSVPEPVSQPESSKPRASRKRVAQWDAPKPRKRSKNSATERDAVLKSGERIHVTTISYRDNPIRVIRVTDAHGSERTLIHGSDVGKVVERPGNISRLYTPFTEPEEKEVIKVPSDYNYQAGQKAICLTKQGVNRLIYQVKKVNIHEFRSTPLGAFSCLFFCNPIT